MTTSALSALDLSADDCPTVKVSILGSDGTQVSLKGRGDTARAVLIAAAEALGLEAFDPNSVGIVRNGVSVRPDTPVEPGDRITAAPQVANG